MEGHSRQWVGASFGASDGTATALAGFLEGECLPLARFAKRRCWFAKRPRLAYSARSAADHPAKASTR
jgi:hypothetical protein